MLIPAALHGRIAAGEVTVAFRAWLRPTVKAGGTLLTPVGQLAIDAVEAVEPATISDHDARAAGAAGVAEVIASLRPGAGRTVYRITFHRIGDDPRIELRQRTELPPEAWAELHHALAAMDERSPGGPWTRSVLEAIATHPATVSAELARVVGLPRPELKVRVRRLKALGLTESLAVGYRLSPLGERLFAGYRS